MLRWRGSDDSLHHIGRDYSRREIVSAEFLVHIYIIFTPYLHHIYTIFTPYLYHIYIIFVILIFQVIPQRVEQNKSENDVRNDDENDDVRMTKRRRLNDSNETKMEEVKDEDDDVIDDGDNNDKIMRCDDYQKFKQILTILTSG